MALAEAGGGRDWPGVLHVAAAPEGLDYYEKKNYGFASRPMRSRCSSIPIC